MRRQARRERAPGYGRLDVLLLVVALAGLTAIGWFSNPILLGIVVALQLALAGFGAVGVLGPARATAGMGRYLVLPVAAVSMTLAGRLIPPAGATVLLAVFAAATLWGIVRVELAWASGERPKTILELILVAILFAATAAIPPLIGPQGWPPPLVPIGLVAITLALRSAEARGASGADALGQAALQALAVVQLAAALLLLELPGAIAPAVVALGYYAWGGAADALQEGSSWVAVALEFGALGLLGLLMALLVYGA